MAPESRDGNVLNHLTHTDGGIFTASPSAFEMEYRSGKESTGSKTTGLSEKVVAALVWT